MLVATDPMDTADPATPSRRDAHDLAICGTRESVNTNNVGVTTQPGSNALPTAMRSAMGTHRASAARRLSTRASTTERLRHADAMVLVTNDGDPIRTP